MRTQWYSFACRSLSLTSTRIYYVRFIVKVFENVDQKVGYSLVRFDQQHALAHFSPHPPRRRAGLQQFSSRRVPFTLFGCGGRQAYANRGHVFSSITGGYTVSDLWAQAPAWLIALGRARLFVVTQLICFRTVPRKRKVPLARSRRLLIWPAQPPRTTFCYRA